MLIIIPILLFSITPILSFILGIIILATDWKNQEINNNKILWGVLTLLLLGPISSLVFSIQSRKIYKSIDGILDDVDKDNEQEPQYEEEFTHDEKDNEDE
jgi:multisubunit Na+/H+ antiporter MnhG subunit